MTITLTPELSAYWRLGNWLSFEVEESTLEDVERAGIHGPVVVVLDTGEVAFGLTAQGGKR